MEQGRRAVPAVARLGGGDIVMATRTQPWRIAGSETAVYQLRGPRGQLIALRVPLADEPDKALAARWRAWSTLCDSRNPITAPPLARTLGYFADGVGLIGSDLRSRPHPVMAMEWVNGTTLLAAADRAVRDGDLDHLLQLAGQWRTAISALEGAGVSHGNLSADNAIATQRDGIIFVDYDTLWWLGAPSVAAAGTNPAYQHPRAAARQPERRDRFAALLIYTSLLALAYYPELRQKHGDPATHPGGALLFVAKDLAHPDRSPLFDALHRADERTVAELADLLRHTCKHPADEIPALSDMLRNVSRISEPSGRPAPPIEPRESRPPVRTLSQPPSVPSTPGRVDERGAAESGLRQVEPTSSAETNEPGPTRAERTWEQPTPARTSTAIAIARLEQAIAQDDFEGVLLHWGSLQRQPEAGRFVGAVNDLMTRHLRREITEAREANDPARLLRAVADANQFGIAVPANARRAARWAERYLATESRVGNAIAAGDGSTLIDAVLSGELDDVADLGPDADRAISRALAAAKLEQALDRGDDATSAELFTGVLAADRDVLDPTLVNRAELAVSRVEWQRRVRAAVQARDSRAVLQELQSLTPELVEMLTPGEQKQIDRLLEGALAAQKLKTAVQRQDDVAIFTALEEMERQGAVLPDDVSWARIAGARERVHLLSEIRSAAVREPRDVDTLMRLLPMARLTWPDALPDLGLSVGFADLEADVQREVHRRRLREAIARGDRVAIRAVSTPDPFGIVATLDPEERRLVEAAQAERPTYVPPIASAFGGSPSGRQSE